MSVFLKVCAATVLLRGRRWLDSGVSRWSWQAIIERRFAASPGHTTRRTALSLSPLRKGYLDTLPAQHVRRTIAEARSDSRWTASVA